MWGINYTGPIDKDGNKCFLSVMSFKNQRKSDLLYVICNDSNNYISAEDLCKQFTKEKLTCFLDYMTVHPDQEKFIFRNYTVLFRHVFKGLCYLNRKGIVHRDIKCEDCNSKQLMMC